MAPDHGHGFYLTYRLPFKRRLLAGLQPAVKGSKQAGLDGSIKDSCYSLRA